jgi:hypothetical protein
VEFGLENGNETQEPGGDGIMKKKVYERPAIIHTEILESRAVTCTKADSQTCSAVIQS